MNGRSITAAAMTLALLAVSGRVSLAQDRGQEHGQGQGSQNQAPQERKFRDEDRQATQDWVQQHQKKLGAGWRQQDRLSPTLQARLRPGQRLDPELRRQIHPVPADLARRYGPAPRGYRYVVIGGNVVLIDDGYQVHDLFSITIHIP
jgi:Ni/Co efflux regulator RcnB